MRKLIIILAAASLCMVACKKDDNGNNGDNGSADGNYWNIHNTVAKGIKSVEMDNYTYYFDENGREIGSKSSYGESSITYNSDGFPTRIESKDIEDGKVTATEVQTFEYGNKGKWTPVPMGPGRIFHIYMQGLYNGISKVTWEGGYNDGAVMEYKFSGNKLTAILNQNGIYPQKTEIILSVQNDNSIIISQARIYIDKGCTQTGLISQLTLQSFGIEPNIITEQDEND